VLVLKTEYRRRSEELFIAKALQKGNDFDFNSQQITAFYLIKIRTQLKITIRGQD